MPQASKHSTESCASTALYMDASEQALVITFSTVTTRHGRSDGQTINSAINLAATYCSFGRLAESKKILREQITIARHRGPDDHMVLTLRAVLAETVIQENDPTEAVAIFEDVDRRMRRVLGPAHPQSQSVRRGLEEARAKLLAFHDAADGA